MLDMKEKMVELLADLDCNAKYCKDCEFAKDIDGCVRRQKEIIADRLIDSGVTVQECGHWKIIMDDYDCEMMCCSVCGSEFYDGDNDTVDCLHNYCPHCGAKMLPQPPKGE
jgi:DNA-directed RNA polymerase subunit RPC12/RpoP